MRRADGVGCLARRKRNDDAHRPRRIGLRPRHARESRQRCCARSQTQELPAVMFHESLSGSRPERILSEPLLDTEGHNRRCWHQADFRDGGAGPRNVMNIRASAAAHFAVCYRRICPKRKRPGHFSRRIDLFNRSILQHRKYNSSETWPGCLVLIVLALPVAFAYYRGRSRSPAWSNIPLIALVILSIGPSVLYGEEFQNAGHASSCGRSFGAKIIAARLVRLLNGVLAASVARVLQ